MTTALTKIPLQLLRHQSADTLWPGCLASARCRVFGAGPYSMRVWLDPEQARRPMGSPRQDVLTAVRSQNVQVVAGQLGAPPVPKDQPFQFTINALGRLSDASQFEDIIIKPHTGEAPQIVRLRDMARVDLGQQTYSNFANRDRPQICPDRHFLPARRQCHRRRQSGLPGHGGHEQEVPRRL